MSLSEPDRHRLYEHLRQVLDDQDANTLMAHLPPGGWAETATTSDLSTFQSLTTAEIDAVRVEMHSLIANLRTEMGAEFTQVRAEMGAEFTQVRAEMATGLVSIRTELGAEIAVARTEATTNAAGLSNDINDLRSEMYRSMSSQTRTMVLAFVASNATVLTLALGLARFA